MFTLTCLTDKCSYKKKPNFKGSATDKISFIRGSFHEKRSLNSSQEAQAAMRLHMEKQKPSDSKACKKNKVQLKNLTSSCSPLPVGTHSVRQSCFCQ